MVNDVVCVTPDTTLIEAIKIMDENAPETDILNQLPVVEDGKLVGIISDGDIIKVLL